MSWNIDKIFGILLDLIAINKAAKQMRNCSSGLNLYTELHYDTSNEKMLGEILDLAWVYTHIKRHALGPSYLVEMSERLLVPSTKPKKVDSEEIFLVEVFSVVVQRPLDKIPGKLFQNFNIFYKLGPKVHSFN